MRLKKGVINYLNNQKQYPTVIAIASGLYPMLYCYSKNFSLVNSVSHFIYFTCIFIVIPVVLFNLVYWFLKKNELEKHSLFILATLNVFTFLFLIKTITYSSAQRKITLLVVVLSFLFSWFLRRYLKRLVVLQYLLALLSFSSLLFIIYTNLTISNGWQKQPDSILSAQFKKNPNVYVIQPDGYVNFSELSKGFYNYDNSQFESFLEESSFTMYPNFRSNYSTTLSSNSSFFMMRHHYYNNRISNYELYNARNMIVSNNPVLDIFKSNNYKTYFITETGYMMFNKPKMGYDYCNFSYNNIPYIRPGITDPIDIKNELSVSISENIDQPKFFFIQMLKPWHIKSKSSNSSNDKNIERKKWLENLEKSNDMLTETIKLIKEKDKNALIVIMADHGGYVGMNYAGESDTMTTDRDLIYSIFSSQLSIHWPNNDKPDFNEKFKSSVNVFRLLFTYLSEDETYLSQLQPDLSYKVLREGVAEGIYEYIDTEGKIILREHQ